MIPAYQTELPAQGWTHPCALCGQPLGEHEGLTDHCPEPRRKNQRLRRFSKRWTFTPKEGD